MSEPRDQRPTIVLIVSLGHSGSTLLDAALGSMPENGGLGEALRLADGINYTRLLDAEGRQRMCTCGRPAALCPVWAPIIGTLGENMQVSTHYPGMVRSLRNAHPEVRFVVDSSPGGLDYLDQLNDYNLRVIRLTRDVRSWVASRKRRKGGSLSGAYGAWWRGNIKMDRKLSRASTPVMPVGYEELAIQPRRTLNLICDWLGITFSDSGLRPFEHTKSHILNGNLRVRRSVPNTAIRFDAAWMRDTEQLLLHGFLQGFCMKKNARLVYSNDVVGGPG
jgi:hypothetical protein